MATNTTDLGNQLMFAAEAYIDDEDRARKALAKAVTAGITLDSNTLRRALVAQAVALPWRRVAARIEKAGAARALESVREEYTELLLERSESQSTCAITNETDRMNRDAARDFLRATKRMG
jgi:hypothetical protein